MKLSDEPLTFSASPGVSSKGSSASSVSSSSSHDSINDILHTNLLVDSEGNSFSTKVRTS